MPAPLLAPPARGPDDSSGGPGIPPYLVRTPILRKEAPHAHPLRLGGPAPARRPARLGPDGRLRGQHRRPSRDRRADEPGAAEPVRVELPLGAPARPGPDRA